MLVRLAYRCSQCRVLGISAVCCGLSAFVGVFDSRVRLSVVVSSVCFVVSFVGISAGVGALFRQVSAFRLVSWCGSALCRC